LTSDRIVIARELIESEEGTTAKILAVVDSEEEVTRMVAKLLLEGVISDEDIDQGRICYFNTSDIDAATKQSLH
jgi:hypothetical protein